MRLDYTTSSLVILGGWNPNIVNEMWIKKNLLDNPNEQLNVNISGNMSSTGICTAIIEALFSNVRLTILGERLELNLIDSNDFTHIEICARKLCNYQPNILVSGYGVNFTYIADTISNDLINIFRFGNLPENPLAESHTYSIELGGITTNISFDINNRTNKSSIRFNFHFNIDALSTLIQRMTEYPIDSLNEKAIEFASSQYGLRLEN